MNKEFNNATFKKAVSNMSGFLKDKNVEISHITLLNSLSLFLGHKNWNTLKNILDNEKQEKAVVPILMKEDNTVDNFIFEDRVVNFIESFNDKSIFNANILSAAVTIMTNGFNVEDFNLIDHGDICGTMHHFEYNSSLDDERLFSIQIANKDRITLPFLDILVILYAIGNKWFDQYVMGRGFYSYTYNKKINKEVLKISLPIDNFLIDNFKLELTHLESFVKKFLRNARFNVNEIIEDSVSQAAINLKSVKNSAKGY